MPTARKGGICTQKYFILGTWLLCNLNDTFATLYILTTPTAPHTKLFRKTKVYLKRQLRPKVTIKGMKKLKLKVQKFEKKSRFLYVFSGTKVFFFFKCFVQEACSLKLGQPWLRQAFNVVQFSRQFVRIFLLFIAKTFVMVI